jgi:hypothetical protein
VHERALLLITKKYEFQLTSGEEEVLSASIFKHPPFHLSIDLRNTGRAGQFSFENTRPSEEVTLFEQTCLLYINKI